MPKKLKDTEDRCLPVSLTGDALRPLIESLRSANARLTRRNAELTSAIHHLSECEHYINDPCGDPEIVALGVGGSCPDCEAIAFLFSAADPVIEAEPADVVG